MGKVLSNRYTLFKYIGTGIVCISGGLLGLLLDGKQLLLGFCIFVLCMIGEAMSTFGATKMSDKYTYIYYSTDSDSDIAVTQATTINEAINNFSDYYEDLETENIVLVTYSEITPTRIIK